MLRTLLLTGLLASASLVAVPAFAGPLALDVTPTDDPQPKPEPEKKDQVTYWVLNATGAG